MSETVLTYAALDAAAETARKLAEEAKEGRDFEALRYWREVAHRFDNVLLQPIVVSR